MSNDPVKFLLVDDLEENLLALAGLLRREGLELLKAQTGPQALELLLVHDIALAIVDVQMPGMDGFELAELMRGTERTRRVPIIFVTAGAVDVQRRFRGYETGAVDFLFKPIEPRILQSKAEVFFELYCQRREVACQRDQLRSAAEENGRLLEESRRAQEALRELNATLESKVAQRTAEVEKERQRLYDVLEALPAMICLLTPDYHVAFANRSFREKFGESQGRHCYDFCFGRGQPCEFCETYTVLQTGQPHQWEVTSPDGRTIIEAYDFPFTDVDGSPLILEMDLDITERKRAEAALQGLNETLKHRARQLQKLTLEVSQTEDRERKRMADILHDDLQQQLAAAKFHLSLLGNRAKHDPHQRDIVAQIDQMLKEAVEKSRSLSHDLSPAVLYQGGLRETFGWLARQMQARHGLTVRVEARHEVNLQSDAVKAFLYKAGQELLFNVVKHARVNEAVVRVRRLKRYVGLSVADCGRGFDPQGLKEATGFGLFSIRERVELLGGHMKIKSAEGKGSTFLVVVPDEASPDVVVRPTRRDVRTPRAPSLRDKPVPMAGGHPLRVLVADDHEVVRQGLKGILSEEPDVEMVGEAANGREAVDLAGRLEPDVVIMDVSMPLISGDQATRQIKMHLPNTRVVALSMYDEPETVERMHRAGAEAYVLKTAPSEELLAAIRGKEPTSQRKPA